MDIFANEEINLIYKAFFIRNYGAGSSYVNGARDFLLGKLRVCPEDVATNQQSINMWYLGWDEARDNSRYRMLKEILENIRNLK